MLFPHLISTALLAVGGGHADLHPATANVYFELPDLEKVYAAYQEAPVVVFFKDESIREFAALVAGEDPETFDLGTVWAQAMEKLYQELPPVAEQALNLLPEVRGLSASLSGVELAGLDDLLHNSGGMLTPEMIERLAGIEVRVVLEFRSAEAVDGALELLKQAAARSGGELSTRNIEAVPLGGNVEAQVLTLVPELNLQAWAIRDESRLLLGAGMSGLERFATGGASLGENEEYRASGRYFADVGGTPIYDSYVQLEDISEIMGLLSLIDDVPTEPLIIARTLLNLVIPGDTIQSRSRSNLVGDRFIAETFLRSFGDGATLPDMIGHEPVTPECFRLVPEDAVSVWGTTLDRETFRSVVVSGLAELSGEDPEQLLETMDDRYGTRPDRDILGVLGDEMVFYTMPFAGISMPKVYLAFEVTDPDILAKGLEGLGEFLVEMSEGAVEFQFKPYRKHPFMSFAPGKDLKDLLGGTGEQAVDMTPAFISLVAAIGIVEDRAVVSLSSMYTKREMKRLMRKEGGVHPLASSTDIIPADAISYGTTEWGAILTGIYDAIKGFIPLIQQAVGGELPFSADDLPPSSIFNEYFRSTVSFGRKVEGGTYDYNESSFGPEVPATLAAVAGAGVLTLLRLQQSATPSGATIDEPTDPTEITLDALREIKIATVLYKHDHGEYPIALAELLKPTDTFPGGFLDGGRIPRDAWGNDVLYFLSDEGTSFRIWSSGPDGVNQGGSGDDVDLSKR